MTRPKRWAGWTLLIATALVEAACADAQEAGGKEAKREARNAATLKTPPLTTATSVQPTDDETTKLLKRVGEDRGFLSEDLERDAKGNVCVLTLRSSNANDQALSLVTNLNSLRELGIYGRGWPETGEWTRDGISQLHKLPDLEKLRVACVAAKPSLETGVFKEICSLGGLKSLILVAASPQRPDYMFLTNLQNLVELNISWATNFGDAELSSLTNLPKLRSVYFYYDAISRRGTNVFRYTPGLTNITVILPSMQP